MTYPPLFSVVIPTIGRSSLINTLASIRKQTGPGWVEILAVADSYQPNVHALANVRSFCREYGASYLEFDAGSHDTGSPQLHHGYMLAQGAWILNCGDDDVYEPGTFKMLSEIVIPDHTPIGPLMFKVELHPNDHRGNREPVVLWDRQEISEGHVTGQSFVTPNDPHRLGRWVSDWVFMRETVALWGGRIEWRDELIMRCY